MSDETSELNGGKPKGVPFVRKRGDGANGELRHWWQYGEHGYVARYDYADGSKETIPYFRWEDDKWKPGGPKTPSPLFGLESIQDQSPNTTIYVCEGEKATAALHALKLPAVTSQGGSQAAHKADWSPLADVQRIVLLPDHDEAGEKYADSVLGRLANFGYQGEAFISRLPDLPEHGDVVEWIKKRACLWDEYGPIPLNPGDGLVDELLSEIEDHSELAKLATLALAIRENEKTAILSDGSEEEYEDYPIDALGDLLGSAARGLQEGVQAPDALCAQSVLAAASLAVQAHANVVIDGRVIPLSLFHLTVGESGERKSTLDTAALRPHREYQKDLFSQYKIALETHRKDEAAFKKTETQVLTEITHMDPSATGANEIEAV